jgi:lauroyl/myristoyl acyltransferase
MPLPQNRSDGAGSGSSATGRTQPLVSRKDVLWFLYLYVFRPLAARLPLGLLYRIGHWMEPACQWLLRADKRRLRERLEPALGVAADALEAIPRRFVSNAVVRVIDDLAADRVIDANLANPPGIHGLDHLQRALQPGNGALIVNGHFFANRAARRWLARMGYPILAVRLRRPRRSTMGRLGQKYLLQRYSEFLHTAVRDEVDVMDPECTLKILQRLRAGGLVNIYLDGLASSERATCPFLGARSEFPTGFLRIARLSGCAIVPMVCAGNARRPLIRFDEPFRVDPRDDAGDFISANLPRLVRIMEAQILHYPDQWELWLWRDT